MEARINRKSNKKWKKSQKDRKKAGKKDKSVGRTAYANYYSKLKT